jgi:hypothetical protein
MNDGACRLVMAGPAVVPARVPARTVPAAAGREPAGPGAQRQGYHRVVSASTGFVGYTSNAHCTLS